MTLNDAELAALASGVVRFGDLFRLETDPVVRLWLGVGDLAVEANVLDVSGGTYLGLGDVGELPEIDVMINGAASRVEFTMSGVSGTVAAKAAAHDTDSVKGKRTSLGFVIFDQGWQMLGPPRWYAHYRADYLSVDRQPVTDLDSKTVLMRSIRLSCGSLMTTRRRPARSYFSDADQQARHPGDMFCSLVPKYANGFSKQWPVFS